MGEHDASIRETLMRRECTEDRWWSALVRVLEGFAVMGKQVRTRLAQEHEQVPLDWSQLSLTGNPVM